MKNRKSIRILSECAIMIALGTVLSLIKIIKLPFGGSVTLVSMLPVCLVSVKYGNRVGLFAGFGFSTLQLLIGLPEAVSWGLTPLVFIAMLFLDYLFAFTVLGIAGTFRRKGLPGILGGIALAVFGRFVCHYISGVALWGGYAADYGFTSPWIYSLAYNGSYIGLEMVFVLIVAAILFQIKPVRALLLGPDMQDPVKKAGDEPAEDSGEDSD